MEVLPFFVGCTLKISTRVGEISYSSWVRSGFHRFTGNLSGVSEMRFIIAIISFDAGFWRCVDQVKTWINQ